MDNNTVNSSLAQFKFGIEPDPMRYAGLVHDLIYDRMTGSERDLDCNIVERYRDMILEDCKVVLEECKNSENNPAQYAISMMIDNTHREMLALGCATNEERGPLVVGRMLFAAKISAEIH